MPKLLLGMQAASQCIKNNPAQCNYRHFATTQLKRRNGHEGRNKPYPAKGITQQGPGLAHWFVVQVHQTDIPGFHGQSLAFTPKPDEIYARDQQQKNLHRRAVGHGVAALRQCAEQIASDEKDGELQYSLV